MSQLKDYKMKVDLINNTATVQIDFEGGSDPQSLMIYYANWWYMKVEEMGADPKTLFNSIVDGIILRKQ